MVAACAFSSFFLSIFFLDVFFFPRSIFDVPVAADGELPVQAAAALV